MAIIEFVTIYAEKSLARRFTLFKRGYIRMLPKITVTAAYFRGEELLPQFFTSKIYIFIKSRVSQRALSCSFLTDYMS